MATTTSTCRRSSSSDGSLPAISFGWSRTADGDLGGSPPRSEVPPATGPLAAAPGPWTWVHQVHGATVLTVTRPGQHAGAEADALVTDVAGCTLAIRTADCAPLVLEGTRAVAVLHLGWRSLAADLVSASAAAMAELDDTPLRAHLGPCIRSGCYEFGADDLAPLVDRFGPSVRGVTRDGRLALDLSAGIRVALREHGVEDLRDGGECTACGSGWFSHRARGDDARMATAAWIEE